MSTYTKNLNLFKYDVTADEKVPFSITDALNNNWDIIDEKCNGGLEICDIGMTLYVDESKGLRRYLNGQIVDINTNTQKFLDRLKQITTLYPSLLCTEDEWQTAKTLSAFGQVGKFVFNYNGDEIISVRIPAIVNVQGLFDLQNLGMTVSAGLPNITGSVVSSTSYIFLNNGASGAFKTVGTNSVGPAPSSNKDGNNVIDLNASRSNPIYGNSNTVQQEAIQYPYFIQIATGAETQNNIVNDIELNNPYVFGKSEYSKTPKDNLSWLASKGQWNPKGSYPSYYDWILENVNKGTENFKGTTGYGFRNTNTEHSDWVWWISTETPHVGQTVYSLLDTWIPNGIISSLTENGFVFTTIDTPTTFTTYRDATTDRTDWITDYDWEINTADETFRLPLLDGSESLPSGRYDELVFGASGTWYRASANGWFYFETTNAPENYFSLLGKETSIIQEYKANTAFRATPLLQVVRGEQAQINYSNSPNVVKSRFYYAQGNGTLYYYVGETVQNANLIDAGRIGEQIVDFTSRIEEQLANKVSKSGDVMSGKLIIKNSSPSMLLQNPNADRTTTPSNFISHGRYYVTDKNNNVSGFFFVDQDTGNLRSGFAVEREINGEVKGAYFIMGIDNNGKTVFSYPQIVSRYTNGTSWYRVWSDGWKEQGFTTPVINWGDNDLKTYNLVIPFSNNNYTVVATSTTMYIGAGVSSGNVAVEWTSTTQIGIGNDARNTFGVRVYACGY